MGEGIFVADLISLLFDIRLSDTLAHGKMSSFRFNAVDSASMTDVRLAVQDRNDERCFVLDRIRPLSKRPEECVRSPCPFAVSWSVLLSFDVQSNPPTLTFVSTDRRRTRPITVDDLLSALTRRSGPGVKKSDALLNGGGQTVW